MTKLLRSTSLRLALAYAALFVVSSILLIGLLWWTTAGYLERETDAVIAADVRAIGDRLKDFGVPGAIQTVNERVLADTDQKAIYLLTDPLLNPLAGNLDAWPLKIGRTPGWYEMDLVYENHLHATRLLHVVLPGDFQLIIGRDVQERIAMRALFLRGVVWAVVAAFLLAVVGGLMIRRVVLRRIETINRTAGAIMQGDLGRRVALQGGDDEFDHLALTINKMLDQIQQLVEGVRNVSNAVAHDLRTPLAELRARLEALLREKPAAERMLDEVGEAVADIDRLIGTFNALLRLAEVDSGLQRAGFTKVDLKPLMEDVAELYGPSAEAKGISLRQDIAADLQVDGDPYLLAQAVGNLLDNAVKYTPAGGTIALALKAGEDGYCRIGVSDSGPGIPEAERALVTRRFYRGDLSRSTSGAGLGLSLVEAVVRLHGGRLALTDNSPGLMAVISLPLPSMNSN
ncbi:MAG TPA: HAMP domain-containing sensor histidine kinase [Ferrovibrio sp.]|uniref:sensor histidine kinase n=1 Tax=Ferrovibrio sp. TaxID=1917215 RepID=UPI002ED02704